MIFSKAMPRNSNSLSWKTANREMAQPMMMVTTLDSFDGPAYADDIKPKAENLVLQTVRQYFPETWLWNIQISKYDILF
jgi:hypothetical protein